MTGAFVPSAVLLLAAIIRASASDTVAVLDLLTPDDVHGVDAPTAVILDVARELAGDGLDPAPELVQGEALRRGVYAGHHGDLARTRLADAVTARAEPAALWLYAANLAADLLRNRMIAAGESIAEHARNGAETDAWTGFVRDGRALRRLHDIVQQLRHHAGQEHAA
ncbi:hypothetical protein [Gordonia neofelifaecis]|nr:hypothetical protein [Gordonia neofelifaecis]